MSPTFLASTASLVALAFTMSTFERWLDRRRPQDLAWSLALAMFTVAATALWHGSAVGWGGLGFRVFYLFGAVLDVPVLALGTVYLLARRTTADRCAAFVALASAFATGVVISAPLRRPVPVHRLPQGSEVFGALPRALAAVASAGGATLLLGGAVASAAGMLKNRRPGGTRMVVANGLIALGTVALSASGLLNSLLGDMQGFATALLAGISLLFAGFLVAAGSGRAA
jgi:hypothetical protein